MKHTKRRLELLAFYDHTGIEQHLTNMAQQGWMLEKIGTFGWVYRRTEPKLGQFAVTYYPKASEFDLELSEGEQRYQEFTAQSGWEFVCRSAQMQVFYTEQPAPIPLETDPVTQVENIHMTAKKSFLPCYGMLLGVAILNGAQAIANVFKRPISTLSSPLQLFALVSCGILFLFCATELAVYFRWLRKAKRAAEHGAFTDTPHTALLQRILLAVLLLTGLLCFCSIGGSLRWLWALSFGYIIALVLLVNGVKNLLKRWKVSRNLNLTLTLVVDVVLAVAMMAVMVHTILQTGGSTLFDHTDAETYVYQGVTYTLHQDTLPLTLEDLIAIDYDGFVREGDTSESIFLSVLRAYQHPRWDDESATNIPSLEYNLVTVKMPFLYGLCRDALLEKYDPKGDVRLPHNVQYQSIDPTPWGAFEAYQLTRETPMLHYLLCYDGRLVEIILDFVPTAEQMQTIGETFSK